MATAGGPVFVVGPMGSGTTLMRLVLDSHPDLAMAPETGLARLLLANEHVPFWKFGGQWYTRLGLTADDLDAALRSFYGGLYQQFAEQRGAGRWGEKTPFHVWHMPRLARVFPDAVFVGTARHPGAVAASLRDRFGYTWQAGVRHWVRSTTEMLYRGSGLGGRFLLCRYEDLVTDPEPPLRALFGWLDEPWESRVLDFHEVHRSRGTQVHVEGRTRSDEPMDPARIARWLGTVDDAALRVLRRDTAALAAMLGYDLADAGPVRSLGDAPVVTGTRVAELMAECGGVDWEHRPTPTLENRTMRAEDIRLLRRRAAGAAPPQPAPAWARRVLRALPPPVRARVRAIRRRRRRKRAVSLGAGR